MSVLFDEDPDVARALELEDQRQRDCIVLIASENYASKAVLEPGASVISNKYAEGYPGRRYYGGCENSDVVESLAIDRVKELFGAEHANVQPHSGAQANMAAYFAVLETGDTVLGMQLDHGGHLTHGANVNFSGKIYDFVPYGLDKDTETIDYQEVARLAKEHKPKLIVAGCSAYPRVLDFARFRAIADSVDALLMVDMAHIAGLVAGGAHPSPFPYANIVTSTTQKSLRGPRGGFILCDEDLARKVDFAVFPFTQGGPLMQAIAGKAVCFGQALKPEFSRYAHQVVANCKVLAADLSEAGMRLVSGGTDNHMVLVDVTPIGITGQQAERALESVGIIANKNAIPFDPQPPRVTSGLRLGTPAITSRGMAEPEVNQLAAMLIEVLADIEDKKAHAKVSAQVKELTARFAVPGIDS
ncbi:MAG: serine hydroxymethyltransferase [SAR202 cluster bacterium]|jgi:glycine hydroxymethyltransferase|nr:serine hydroxymethyltransferase [Dehalococcoidia bacterium]MQF88668.1 serine hydroxymethyltransferase [SAR202 cluster bacterium]|tara:strand:+ start:33567 stop:34811 length:1245 start_codon:yes stop_codon:yes gene_type:complete